MKLIISTFILFILGSFSSINSIDYTTEWKQFKTLDNVEFFYKYADCHFDTNFDRQLILLKMENKNSEAVEVSWRHNNFYGNRCEGCDFPNDEEMNHSQKISGNSTEEGVCSDRTNQLTIFVKTLSYQMDQPLSDFKLANLKVTTLK